MRDRSILFASVAVTLTTLVWTVGSWLADRFVDRLGPAQLVRIGLVVLLVGIGLELLLLSPSVPLAVGLAGTAVAGLGIGLAFSPLAVILLSQVSSEQVGTASSALSLFENLGFAAGPAITSLALEAGEGRGWSDARALAAGWLAAGGVTLLALAASSRLGRGRWRDRAGPAASPRLAAPVTAGQAPG